MKTQYLSAEFVDVDNDGDMDLVLGNWGGYTPMPTDRLLLNDGKGSFRDAAAGMMPAKLGGDATLSTVDVTSMDINNDGFKDLLLSTANTSYTLTPLQLLISDGTGKFMDVSNNILSNDGRMQVGWVRAGDMDGDGWVDLLTFSTSWRNTGQSFVRQGDVISNSAWGDLNGDGLPEVLSSNDLGAEGGEHSTVFLDADGDGDLDVFIAQNKAWGAVSLPARLYINDGLGNLTQAPDTIFTPSPPQFFHPINTVRTADLNGDGLMDIIVGDAGMDLDPFPGGQNRILIQKSNGTLADETSQRLPIRNDYTHGMALGDIDNDGDIDIYMGNIIGGVDASPSFLINDGNGFFTEDW